MKVRLKRIKLLSTLKDFVFYNTGVTESGFIRNGQDQCVGFMHHDELVILNLLTIEYNRIPVYFKGTDQ